MTLAVPVDGRIADLGAALERGFTLPSEWYTDPVVFEREKDRIFHRFWQYAGHTGQLCEPGSFFTCRLGDVPVVVVRDLDGTVRAFANVCRHRGSKIVLDICGQRKTLQCHYHGWTWDLDGSLRTAPRWNEQSEFDKEDFPLVPLPLETWGPLLLVNPDRRAGPLTEVMGDLPQRVTDTGLDLKTLHFQERRTYDIASNWKVLVENFNECYHCPIAHPSFSELVDTDKYSVTTEHTYVALHHSTVRPTAAQGKEGLYNISDEVLSKGVKEACYFLLFPTLMVWINPGPANLAVYTLAPLDQHRTLAIFDFFFGDGISETEAHDVIAFTHQVQTEDIVLCESVQQGMRSGFFDQGRLMLSRENGIQHFQQLVYRLLT